MDSEGAVLESFCSTLGVFCARNWRENEDEMDHDDAQDVHVTVSLIIHCSGGSTNTYQT